MVLKKLLKLLGYNLVKIQTATQIIENESQNPSWSQEGEDLILNRYFEFTKTGTYVDVGAHDPFRFSNTYKFYLKDWTGINIEANPDKLQLFNKFRSRDININSGVSDVRGFLEFYRFEESALNTFDFKIHEELIKKGWAFKDTIKIPVKTLNEILNEYNIKDIGFLTIDVEGLDFHVLKGLDLQHYKPEVILIEAKSESEKEKITHYLNSFQYLWFAQTINTMFFKRSN